MQISKADPTLKAEPVENVIIEINIPIPQFATIDEWKSFCKSQGKELADVLWSHLAGGVMDQLIAELLERKASLFRVTF